MRFIYSWTQTSDVIDLLFRDKSRRDGVGRRGAAPRSNVEQGKNRNMHLLDVLANPAAWDVTSPR